MLGTDRDHLIRKVLNGTAPNPEIESEGIRADLIAAVWPSGPTFPTAPGELWTGRIFRHTGLKATFIYSGTGWVEVAAPWLHAASGADATNFGPPPQGTELVHRTGYVKTFTSSAGKVPVTFGSPFPARCLHVSMTPIEGPAVQPVIDSRTMGASGFTAAFSGVNTATIAMTYHAVGY